MPRFRGMVFEIQFSKTIGSGFSRRLLENETHPTALAELFHHQFHMGDHLQSEFEGLFGLMQLLTGVNLNHFIEPHHADQETGTLHSQVRRSIPVHGQEGKRSLLAQREEFLNEIFLFEMGPDGHFNEFSNF